MQHCERCTPWRWLWFPRSTIWNSNISEMVKASIQMHDIYCYICHQLAQLEAMWNMTLTLIYKIEIVKYWYLRNGVSWRKNVKYDVYIFWYLSWKDILLNVVLYDIFMVRNFISDIRIGDLPRILRIILVRYNATYSKWSLSCPCRFS